MQLVQDGAIMRLLRGTSELCSITLALWTLHWLLISFWVQFKKVVLSHLLDCFCTKFKLMMFIYPEKKVLRLCIFHEIYNFGPNLVIVSKLWNIFYLRYWEPTPHLPFKRSLKEFSWSWTVVKTFF